MYQATTIPSESLRDGARFCRTCGTMIEVEGRFCARCGTSVAAAQAEPQTPVMYAVPAVAAAAPYRRSQRRPARRCSLAWIYYTILSVLGLIVAFGGAPIALVGTVICGLYALYLYRGGRVIIWIW